MQQESAVKSAADADRLAAIAAVQHPRAAAPDRRSKQPLQTAADAECICTCSEGADRRTVFFGQTFLPSQPPQYPTRLEAGTRNGHGIAGLLAAVEFIRETGMDAIRTHELALARRFYEGVRDVDGVHVYGDFSSSMRAPVVALNIRNEESSIIADALAEDYAIAVRAGAHCAPRMHKALGTVEQGAVRFSFGYYNTEEETDAAIAAVRELAEQ